MASAPVYIGTPKTWKGAISTANTNRDGSGTAPTIMSGGTNGSRIELIRIIATITITADVVRLFLSDGSTVQLFKEVLMAATTPSTTVETATQDLSFPAGLVIPNAWSLKAATDQGKSYNIFAHGGDY